MQIITNLTAINARNERAFGRAGDECVGEAKRHAPVGVSRGMKLNAGSVQGGLRASIHLERKTALSGRFGSSLRYAAMREYGGTIVPVRAKMLSWVDPITGKRVFARRVTQRPGGPRQGYKPWLRPAGDKFPQFMDDHIQASAP